MKPIFFSCRAVIPRSPGWIGQQILDLRRWPEFEGYLFLPGIQTAEFEKRTDAIVGTRIRVTNTDGSTHVEEIVGWDLPNRLSLRLSDFSLPLSKIATRFDETWLFDTAGESTAVVRQFELFPATAWSRPLLWLISGLLRGAVAKHLQQIVEHPSA